VLAGMLAACGAASLASGVGACGPALAQALGAPAKGKRARPWETLPPTPRLPQPIRSGLISANGVRLFYAQYVPQHGQAPQLAPHVLLLHGGMGSSNYWGHLIDALSPAYAVTVLDTRGHGRSPFVPATAFSYKLLADDAAAALAALGVPSAAVVGWSDGAIAALQMAVSHPSRVTRVFAFGGNITLGGYKANGSRAPVFAAYVRRCRAEYAELSPHPEHWPALLRALGPMWRTDPGMAQPLLAALRVPVTVSDGAHDEIIKREHTEMMARLIPGASLRILPDVSHFAMLQKPDDFNRAVTEFLSG
jgi:pimeloyl-ACP methyl ester carboxylesterase